MDEFSSQNDSEIPLVYHEHPSSYPSNVAKKEEEVKLEATMKSLKCLQCENCEFLTFSQLQLISHSCKVPVKIDCPGCANKFTTNESLKSHLTLDHKVSSEEIDRFVAEKPSQNEVYDAKRSENVATNQPKSKIFIKDVTLLRKPDLPIADIAIPNIFDSLDTQLDLTTTEDDILDDFLASDDQIFDDEFDFDDSANLNSVSEVEIVTPAEVTPDSGKIFVRKNLCETEDPTTTSKIYVRSHESLTSQVITTNVTKQPSEASTPDCIIVSSEVIKEAPNAKIFIRDIETLQEASANQMLMNFPPTIYDSLRPEPGTSPQVPQQRCKISIKNMNTLIEPNLMQPPLINTSSMIFGQAQNLVIHMRSQTDESLLNYRDTSMTPDTLPGSSNVSTCGGNDDVCVRDDDVIVLDDSEAFFNAFFDATEIVKLMGDGFCEVQVTEHPPAIETPERNETPNDKTVLEKLGSDQQMAKDKGDNVLQPMVSIPMDFSEAQNFLEPPRFTDSFQSPLQKLQDSLKSQNFLESDQKFAAQTPPPPPPEPQDPPNFPEPQEPQSSPDRKRMKIVKIIKVKTKKLDEISNKVNFTVIFRCNVDDCSQHFTTDQLLKYHKRCHGEKQVLVCPECKSEDFKNFNTLHTHLWRQHKVDMDLYSCKLCDFKTPILSRLKNFHEKIHSDEKNFKCECGKSFKNSKQLKNHAQIHKKPSARVKVKSTKLEDGEKKLKCPDCSKCFSSDSGLYIHSMEHKNDEKKFNCKSCNYSTNDHNSFRRHKAQHSQLHHYKCPSCDYTSIQSNTYRKHLEKQHPELAESLLYKCSTCKFTTISKAKYEGHLTKHCEGDNGKQKIKVKSNLQLTDPARGLMRDLLPNQANENL